MEAGQDTLILREMFQGHIGWQFPSTAPSSLKDQSKPEQLCFDFLVRALPEVLQAALPLLLDNAVQDVLGSGRHCWDGEIGSLNTCSCPVLSALLDTNLDSAGLDGCQTSEFDCCLHFLCSREANLRVRWDLSKQPKGTALPANFLHLRVQS